jgi:hypothetical protein
MGCGSSKLSTGEESEQELEKEKIEKTKTKTKKKIKTLSESNTGLYDKDEKYYHDTLHKIQKLSKNHLDLIKNIPEDEPSRKEYFDQSKLVLNKYKITEQEFYDGALWQEMHESFQPEMYDLIDLYTDIFLHSYTYESKARDKANEFNRKLGQIKNYNFFKQKGIAVQEEEDDGIFEKLIEFMRYDQKVEETEAVAFLLTESQYSNPDIIQRIANIILKFINVVNLVIVLGKSDESRNFEAVTFDHFIPIFEAIADNTKIHAFGIISPSKVSFKFSEKNQAIIVDTFKKNQNLTLATLSKIYLDSKFFKSLINTLTSHKNMYAFGYDLYGKFNDEYFDIFREGLKKSKLWTIACYYNGLSEADIDNRHDICDEFKENKFLAISLPFNLN